MKRLSDILYKCDLNSIQGSTDVFIADIATDSRQVANGWLFIAVRGVAGNGHDYIQKAITQGAAAVVCSELPDQVPAGITLVEVADTVAATGIIASNFFENPSENLKLVGVTGTNGKTTIATQLHILFTNLGNKCGLISTIINKIGETEIPATHTTPDTITLNRLLARMVGEGCNYCFMEVSSHAIDQRRIEGVRFEGAIFSNITHDHLDYHQTFKNYLIAKKAFFDNLDKKAFALTNIDDKNGAVMLQNTQAHKYSYGLKNIADYKGKIIGNMLNGLVMVIDGREVYCKLVGEFNAANIMAIYGASRLLGIDTDVALTGISELNPVEGRFDFFVNQNNVIAIVDYAHTPDALENVLKTISNLRTGTEKVITVVGCGGNRDKEKRPAMAAIAVNLSDRVILTSDNPRNEDPLAILDDMKKGVEFSAARKVLVIENRAEAIKTAAALTQKGDIILVAGKGHEKYQEIQGVKYPFDDKKVLFEALI